MEPSEDSSSGSDPTDPSGGAAPDALPGGTSLPGEAFVHLYWPGPAERGWAGDDVEPAALYNYDGQVALAYFKGEAFGGETIYNLDGEVRLFHGRYRTALSAEESGAYCLLRLDLHPQEGAEGSRTFRGGSEQSPILWTFPVDPRCFRVTATGAELVLDDVGIVSSPGPFDPSESPAKINLYVRWEVTGSARAIVPVRGDLSRALAGTFRTAGAVGEFSGRTIDGFEFATGVAMLSSTFAELGTERNGVFLESDD